MTRGVLALLLAAAAARADLAVTVHGTIEEAEAFRVEGAELVEVRKSNERRHALEDFYLVEAQDGRLLWAPDFERRIRGYAYLARSRRMELCVDLLGAALGARDKGLARLLLERAEADGFTGKEAESLKRKLEQLEQKSPTVHEKRAAAVRERIAEADALLPDLLLARARTAEPLDSLRLLREALRAAPEHAGARKMLAERAPGDFPIGDARFWLDWRLDLETHGAKVAPDGNELRVARAGWRTDLWGLEAGPIRILTPVKDTRTVGRCLAYGHLTCSVLGGVFETPDPKPRAAKALTVLLYGNRDEYLATSGGGRAEARAFLEWTVGHYAPAEQVSRVAWSDDRDAERRIARVFVHELTHHWTMEMNPRYADREVRPQGPSMPGYWIVEGFATLLEEGSYDIESGTWTLFDSRAMSLDIVQALAGTRQLIPWKRFYEMNHAGFLMLPREANIRFTRRWSVGPQVRSPGRLFYEQAGATCQFLYHADGGRHRAKMVDYITARYTGKKEKMDILDAFGMTPIELGGRVEQFAKEVAAGWRPEPAAGPAADD